MQSSDGGFPFIAATNQASDPNSTALVIQALVAESSSPASTQWEKGTNTPFTALASYQLGCTSRATARSSSPAAPSAEHVRDRAGGPGDGRQDAAGRNVDGVGHDPAHGVLTIG